MKKQEYPDPEEDQKAHEAHPRRGTEKESRRGSEKAEDSAECGRYRRECRIGSTKKVMSSNE